MCAPRVWGLASAFCQEMPAGERLELCPSLPNHKGQAKMWELHRGPWESEEELAWVVLKGNHTTGLLRGRAKGPKEKVSIRETAETSWAERGTGSFQLRESVLCRESWEQPLKTPARQKGRSQPWSRTVPAVEDCLSPSLIPEAQP